MTPPPCADCGAPSTHYLKGEYVPYCKKCADVLKAIGIRVVKFPEDLYQKEKTS